MQAQFSTQSRLTNQTQLKSTLRNATVTSNGGGIVIAVEELEVSNNSYKLLYREKSMNYEMNF